MGLLDTAESWLRTERAKQAKTVTYSRGAVSNANVKATQAATEYEADTGEVIVKGQLADFLIDRGQLQLDFGSGLEPVEPVAGDWITVNFDHAVVRYEVAALTGEDVFRWHGRDGQTLRIHTVKTDRTYPL